MKEWNKQQTRECRQFTIKACKNLIRIYKKVSSMNISIKYLKQIIKESIDHHMYEAQLDQIKYLAYDDPETAFELAMSLRHPTDPVEKEEFDLAFAVFNHREIRKIDRIATKMTRLRGGHITASLRNTPEWQENRRKFQGLNRLRELHQQMIKEEGGGDYGSFFTKLSDEIFRTDRLGIT